MSRRACVLCLVAVAVLCCQPCFAQGLPLPLHGFEGYSGVFATYSAYFAHPSQTPGKLGMPSDEAIYVQMGNGRNLSAFTYTQTVGSRVELGVAWNNMDPGDLGAAINAATGMTLTDDSVTMMNYNARYMLVKEGPKKPALTFGMHYKHNNQTDSMDSDLAGTLSAIGVTSDHGWDYTLYGSKTLMAGKRPVILDLGLRSSKAAHLGLLGFTGDRDLSLEGNVCFLATNKLVLGAEYRQKQNNYTPIPGLVAAEDDWWTLCAAYIASPRMTFGAGYGHFGEVLNHTANSSWGVKMKYEF